MIDWNIYKELSKRWCEEEKSSPEYVYKFIDKKIEDEDQDELDETRCDMARDIIKIIKKANKENEIYVLHSMFPPAHDPLVDELETIGQAITSIMIIGDNKLFFKTGDVTENGMLYVINNEKIEYVKGGLYAGCSHNKEYYAIAYEKKIEVYTDGNKLINIFKWPKDSKKNAEIFNVVTLRPFAQGNKILLVTLGGIYILNLDGSVMLYPDEEYLEDSDDEEIRLDMVHADISSDDKYIAIGEQYSEHLILDAETYKKIERVDTKSEYADYAMFNSNNTNVLFNSCYFYDGITTSYSLNNLGTDRFEDDFITIEDEVRVYAGVSKNDDYIIGDADGSITSYKINGDFKWQYYVGSTISGIDISRDGKTLLVGSYAGMLHLLKLDYDKNNREQVTEIKRWIAWKGEKDIYQW